MSVRPLFLFLVRPFAISLVAALIAAAPLGAQGGTISGTVTDSLSGDPVVAAEVVVLGTTLRAATRADGAFIIERVPAGTYTVAARRIGYTEKRRPGVVVTDGQTATADFRINLSVLALQEVVVTGVAGETQTTLLPFTVGQISAAQTPVPAANALESLQGKIAGVTVTPSGRPGGGTSIQMRTPTSINKSNFPLIAVDGTILGTTTGASAYADLNALDIERIELVKGAAAASLYGSRAQAGVIQVWTRRGRNLEEGETQITARSEFGVNSLPRKIKWARYHSFRMDPGQTTYVDATGAPTNRAGRVPERTDGTNGEFAFQDNPYPGPVYDQVDAFFNPGTYITNNVSIAQRTERTNWLASAEYHRSSGVLQDFGWFRRADVRVNMDHEVRTGLHLSFSGFYSRSLRDELQDDGGTFFDLINIAPDADLNEPDPDGTPYAFQPDPDGIRPNPLYKNYTEQSWTSRGRFLGNVVLRYIATPWLSLEGNLSYDRADRNFRFFLDRGMKTDDYQTGGPGEIELTNEYADALNGSLSATFTRELGATTMRTVLRANFEREDNPQFTGQGTNLSVVELPDLTNAQSRTVASSYQDIRSNGYIAITGLDYADRYIVDGLVRRDGSSLFGTEERWHTYGRVSAAYRVAEEPWWPIPQINEFKVRFSRGTAGGRPEFQDQFETYTIDAAGVLTKNTLGNPFLRPEHSTETEYGLDVLAFGRLNVQLSYARTKIVDELIQVPLPAAAGYQSQWQNAGTVEGNTFEATVQAQVLTRPDLSWSVTLVADRSRHEITEFDRPCFRTGTSFRCAGVTLGVMYGIHWLRSPSEVAAIHPTALNQFAVNDDGLLVWVGLDPTGQPYRYTQGVSDRLWGTSGIVDGVTYGWGQPIRQLDATGQPATVEIGESNPDFRFGVSNQVRWRDFTLYGLVDVQVGGNVFNATKMRMYQWYRNADEDQVGKPDGLKKPPLYHATLYNGNDESDWFVEPGGFVKLRELSLRYELPVTRMRPLERLGIRRAWVSLVGRNLLTITDFTGYDPEVRDEEQNAVIRTDDFDYPRFRTVTATIGIEF